MPIRRVDRNGTVHNYNYYSHYKVKDVLGINFAPNPSQNSTYVGYKEDPIYQAI